MNKKNHLWKVGIGSVNEQTTQKKVGIGSVNEQTTQRKVGIGSVNEQTTQRKRNASPVVFDNGKCENWLAKIGDNPDYLLASRAMSLFVY